MTAQIRLRPATLKEANACVVAWHRHHKRRHVHRWSIAAEYEGEVVGVAIVANPVGRGLDDGRCLEIARVAVPDGAPPMSPAG